MFEISYIARPLLGAVIGFITNDIAIRMLFRPRRPKHLFGHRIPFTPGIIPKEKARIASSIGKAISENLMNQESIEKTLLSTEMISKIEDAYDRFILAQMSNKETVEHFLAHYVSKVDINYLKRNVSADLAENIHHTLTNSDLGSTIASIITDHVVQKVDLGVFGMLNPKHIIGAIASLLEPMLAKNINQMIEANSRQIVDGMIGNQIESFLHKPMHELFVGREEQIVKIRESIISLYKQLINNQLPAMLKAIDISGIVENRINEMDVAETEKLILEVMNKELRAIVWLGALLGFIMGCINLLF